MTSADEGTIMISLSKRLGAPVLMTLTWGLESKVTEPEGPSLSVVAVTSGDTLDIDGYTLSIAGESVSVESNGTQTITDLTEGTLSLGIEGVAVNCSLEGENPRPMSIAPGTNQVSIMITCVAAMFHKVIFHSDRDGNYAAGQRWIPPLWGQRGWHGSDPVDDIGSQRHGRFLVSGRIHALV
jgi:hypothetical protein